MNDTKQWINDYLETTVVNSISNFQNYHIRIYGINNNLLEEFEGTYDIIFHDNEKIIFIDSDNKQHIIYIKNGIIIIDQK